MDDNSNNVIQFNPKKKKVVESNKAAPKFKSKLLFGFQLLVLVAGIYILFRQCH